MKISVKVKTNAREEKIEKLSEANFSVWVKEKPLAGKANYAVRSLLAGYFGVPKSRVVLLHGEKSKDKVFEVQ